VLDNASSVSLHVIARIKEFIPVGLNASMYRPLLHEVMHRLSLVSGVGGVVEVRAWSPDRGMARSLRRRDVRRVCGIC
jgi:hypothetical protein